MNNTLRVLMLEDNPGDAELNAEQLHHAGLSFTWKRVDTEDGYLRALEELKPDIILADYRLPQFDGHAALRLAGERFPFIPFIIVSGALEEEAAVELLKAGAADYILKDKIIRLGPAVKNALTLREAKEEKARAEEELKKANRDLEGRVRERTRELAATNAALRRSEREFRTLAENMPDMVTRLDRNLRYRYINPAARQVFGLPNDCCIGRTVGEAGMSGEFLPLWKKQLKELLETGKGASMEIEVPSPHGARYYIATNVPERGPDGAVESILTVARDITELRKTSRQVDYLSYHDRITGLYNRAFFEEEIHRLDTARGLPLSIILADINNLKFTNDVYGHEEGDRLLRKIADIMRKYCRDEDIVARWGGDEYAVLLPKTGYTTAEMIARRIKKTCAETMDMRVHCSIAVGVAVKEEPGTSINYVMQLAEERMNKNKLLEGETNRREAIASMLNRIGKLDHDTREHTQRMQSMALRLGKEIGLSTRQLDDLMLFAALHDIGKAGVPENILKKNEKLTAEEWSDMKQHTERGYRAAHAFPELARVAEAILYHHERWDGSGYPKGLKGDRIPLLVRILSIIDAYDVMTHARTYKQPLSQEEAVSELSKGAGKQFDPELVEVFIRTLPSARGAQPVKVG